MRILAGAFALTFLLCAAVQANDPDPLRWIAVYLAAAGLSAAAAMGHAPPRALLAAVGLLAAGWAALLLPAIVREAAFTGNEIEREFGGLALVAAGMAAAWAARGSPSPR